MCCRWVVSSLRRGLTLWTILICSLTRRASLTHETSSSQPKTGSNLAADGKQRGNWAFDTSTKANQRQALHYSPWWRWRLDHRTTAEAQRTTAKWRRGIEKLESNSAMFVLAIQMLQPAGTCTEHSDLPQVRVAIPWPRGT